MGDERIRFNRPAIVGEERAYVDAVFANRKFSGSGPYHRRASDWLESHFDAARICLTSSCTDALEMAALLCDLRPGDEVIVPSFAFPSTAAAFVRAGALLRFVDIEPATMNLDPAAVEKAVTSRTRVLVILHYAGVACDMARLQAIADRHGLIIVEDAAQAMLSTYRGRRCGTLGRFGCVSFHESKNIQCGEGGALIVNDPGDVERAEILLEKGTDRTRFMRGEVDRYTWQDIGSSFLLGELNAAFLLAQLERAEEITRDRRASWDEYGSAFVDLARRGAVEVPSIPPRCEHNAHIFWIKLADLRERTALIEHLRERRIDAVFHYVPLHSAPAGRRHGRFCGDDRWTTRESERLLRLPLHHGFDQVDRVATAVEEFYSA